MDPSEFPRKLSAAGCLLRNDAGDVLLVKPTYKEGWEIPGGMVEDDESPLAALRRELREELGEEVAAAIVELRFVCVDYRTPGAATGDAYRFLFDGGVLDDGVVEQVRLPADELSDWRFVSVAQLDAYAVPVLAQRLRSAIAGVGTYLEDGLAR